VFDLDRQSDKPPITFGFGTHFCVGSPLALAELTIGLGVLLEGLPNIHLQEGTDARVAGTVLRGPTALPVRWDQN
jgi:cytochrome P450